MLERADFELLQRQQDGELLPGESKRVEALLATNDAVAAP
jgi:anti-sigma factor RsiW